MKILGVDPGLRHTGWGVICKLGNNITYVDSNVISPKVTLSPSQRLQILHENLLHIIDLHKPVMVAVEQTLVNTNASSSIKLGEARGVILMTPALRNIKVYEYMPKTIKKTVTGNGNADKQQVQKMIHMILPKSDILKQKKDVADALAIALCHAYLTREVI